MRVAIVQNSTHLVLSRRRGGGSPIGSSGTADPRFRVMHNAIDLSLFANCGSRGVLQRDFGLSRDSVLVGHIGRFEEPKNHSFLIRALRPSGPG